MSPEADGSDGRDLGGRVALVTGASRGVGRGIAHELGLAGATVFVTGRSREDGESTGGLPGTVDETARATAPLLLEADRPLIVEISAGDDGEFLGDVQYDLAKAACDRLGFALAEALGEEGVASLTVWPGFTRTERVEAAADEETLAGTHSPRFVGRAVAALASDADVMERSGGAYKVGQLARDYGFRDVDGSLPEPWSLPDG